MRRAQLGRPAEEGLSVIDDAPFAQLAWVDGSGCPQLRSVHAVRHQDAIVFHGAKASTQARLGLNASKVVLQAQYILAQIPSYFVDAALACPATTFYRSVQVEGRLESVEDLADKASALQSIMQQFQPEGGYAAIESSDERYTKNLRGVAVTRLIPERITAKANLGQSRPLQQRTQIIEALWQRGQPSDLDAIEWIRRGSEVDPAPSDWTGELSLHVAPTSDESGSAAEMVEDAYWNEGVALEQIAAAHRASSAWIVARTNSGHLIATARAMSDDTKHAWIYDVFVRPEYRRQGLARRLLRVLLDHPRIRSARLVHLCTKDAQPLYAKLGFNEELVSQHVHMALRRKS